MVFMFKPLATVQYPKFKLAIVALLFVNVFLYALTDTLTSTIDALVWLALLIIYELEATKFWTALTAERLRHIRNVLIVAITLVFFSYVNTSEWLDTLNALFWFVLIGLLELEIRAPDWVKTHQNNFWLATILVFACLIAMVFAWLWQGAWLDAYDGVLWIAAFAFIEVDFFQFLKLKKQ